jgi:regulator of RNase E activity RraA
MQPPSPQEPHRTDAELLDLVRTRLYVPAISDILDSLGLRNQTMHQRLRPLLPEPHACGFVGRARTLLWVETDRIRPEDPYGLEIDAMDSIGPGCVIVHSTDSGGRNAPWGELMTTLARRNGAVGCVCDSNVRDCLRIIALRFPVFCAGIKPVDSKGRGVVTAYDVPVNCGDVLVEPGQLVVADYDGVVVVPRDVEAQVIALALDKVSAENHVRRALEEGSTLRETYNRYGVL